MRHESARTNDTPEAITEARAATIGLLAKDVHEAYISSFEPGIDTPFKPKLYVPEPIHGGEVSGGPIDITNTPFAQLPPKLKQLNSMVADTVIEALDDQFATDAPLIDERFVYGAMVKASCAWARDMVQDVRSEYRPVESRHQKWHEVVIERMADYDSTPQIAQDIDRNMVLVVIASVIKSDYSYWPQRYDVEGLMNVRGLTRFAALGQLVLDDVQARRDAFESGLSET